MLTEKDLLNRASVDLRDALGAVLERYQRHLMRLEAELAEMRADLDEPTFYIGRQRLTVVRPASFRRPRLCRSIRKEEKEYPALESVALVDQ
jgi:hypothetical protein